MESSFYNKENGGSLNDNIIPELFELSKEGITFTQINNQGYYVVHNANFTFGSDVASTSAVNLSYAFVNNLLTKKRELFGVYTLGDILYDSGYKNIMMLGSPIEFAGTDYYYKLHGNYDFKDYQYAIDNGYIENDYEVFWGYEDKKLFEFAKKELLELSTTNKPFNFTIKTIDTHSPGYVCDNCKDKYDIDYLNVLSCSSELVNDFINWIKQQSFYDNTTIVLMGDHISMDTSISQLIDKNYERKPFFVILNSAIPTPTNNTRKFTTLDIYPTVLASLGVTYNSDRLGLGTNLFSNTKTLFEEMGDDLFTELSKTSDFYNKHLIVDN